MAVSGGLEVVGVVLSAIPLHTGGLLHKVAINERRDHVHILHAGTVLSPGATVRITKLTCKTLIFDGRKHYVFVAGRDSEVCVAGCKDATSVNQKFIYSLPPGNFDTAPHSTWRFDETHNHYIPPFPIVHGHIETIQDISILCPCLYYNPDISLDICTFWVQQQARQTLSKHLNDTVIKMLKPTVKTPKHDLHDILRTTGGAECKCSVWLHNRYRNAIVCLIDNVGRAVTNTTCNKMILPDFVTTECVALILDPHFVTDLLVATNVQILLPFDRKLAKSPPKVDISSLSNIHQLPHNVCNDLVVSVRAIVGWTFVHNTRRTVVLIDAETRVDRINLYFVDDRQFDHIFAECVMVSDQIANVHAEVVIEGAVLRRGRDGDGRCFLILPSTAGVTMHNRVVYHDHGQIRECFSLDELKAHCGVGEVLRCRVMLMSLDASTAGDIWAVYKVADGTFGARLVVENHSLNTALRTTIMSQWWLVTAVVMAKECLWCLDVQPVNTNTHTRLLFNILDNRTLL